MKEDTQLICPIGYEDKNDIWPIIQKFICDRLPLKDVTWRSNISSSFVNIEKLPLRFLPAAAKLFNETQHPYRRFLAPYVNLYLLCAESMDAYKAAKSTIKKWVELYNSTKAGRQPWIIIYVPLGTSTLDVYAKVYARLASDFYTDKSGDRSVMLTIPPETKRTNATAQERLNQQQLFQQAYAALADLLGKLRDGVVASFQLRMAQYDADIRRLDMQRGTPSFDFWQLFLVKESLALMFQMLQMPDRALSLYDELEVLLPFAPYHSLPVSDWPMVVPEISSSSNNGNGSSSSSSPAKTSSRSQGQSDGTRDASPAHSDQRLQSSDSAGTPFKASAGGSSGSAAKAKKDLMTDACRCGDDIIVYSINQARMNILWNRSSFFQLQHYIFARQMYFLLVHLRQPTRCAEKALGYMRTASAQLEQRLQKQYGSEASPSSSSTTAASGTDETSETAPGSVAAAEEAEKSMEGKLLQLRRAQADVWALMASLKLIRECRALLQLLVGGDAAYNNIFSPSKTSGSSGSSAGGASSLSYSHASSSMSTAHESFQDNLAAISSASTHGSSVVYSSLAELSRSQHGITHTSSARKASVGGAGAAAADMSSPLSSTGALSPAAALREVLFSPQLDIGAELRDSSRVLGDLVEFALRRLHALSSSTVKQAGFKALQLAMGVEPFSLERFQLTALEESASVGPRRTVTKVAPGLSEAAAVASVTSPKNADLVVTIEHELALLDESGDAEGVSGVGERMDMILQSISHKVRSTSHFWSKLYELSTPVQLLHPDFFPASNGSVLEGVAAGHESGRAESCDSSSPVGSPFSSRAGTPISSPVPGSSSGVPGSRSLRKVLSRHSSRSLVMSRSQLERGTLLELCLSVLGCSAQWHLQLLANRPRFALTAMLRCADLLLCNGQLTAAAKRLEEALKSGLLAPVAAYICNNRPAGLFLTYSALGEAESSIFQKCLPDAQLHQQQETQHRALCFAAAEVGDYVKVFPLHGAYAQLWHWTLRKLLYCLQRAGDWERYRTVLANLLVPTSADGVTRIPLEPPSLLADILREFIALSTLPSSHAVSAAPSSQASEQPPPIPPSLGGEAMSVPPVPPQDESRESAAAEQDHHDAAVSSAPVALSDSSPVTVSVPAPALVLPLLRLPLGCYVDVQLGMVRPRDPDAVGWAPRLVKGYEVIREEWLPAASMQCEGGREGGYCLPLVLVSHLPGPVPVDALCIVYKRFSADTIINQTIRARDTAGDGRAGSNTVAAVLAVAEDEFVCQPVCPAAPPGGVGAMVLGPGAHTLCMAFQPPSLGDYRLDRIVLVVGTAVFESRMLPEIPHSSDSSSPGGPIPDVPFARSMMRDDMFGSPGLAGLALLDELESGEQVRNEEKSGARVFTAGESAALAALKAYFTQHRIIQVLPPDDLLCLHGTVAPSVPVLLTDDAYFTAETKVGDEVSDLRITASSGVRAGMVLASDLNSPRIASSAAAALKIAQSKSPAGFVPEDQATPAAMRRRRADPLDEDEVEAMASAAAAVASLLAHQAAEGQRATLRRAASGNGVNGVELGVSVSAVSQWAMMSASSTSSVVVTVPLLPVEEGDHSADASAQAVVGKVLGGACLHLRVPFVVHPANSSTAVAADLAEVASEVVLQLELTGTLRRAGCVMPLSVACELRVRAQSLVSMHVDAHHLHSHSINNGAGKVMLQAELRNCTSGVLELTGYGVVPSEQSGASSSLITLDDGPTDLCVFSTCDPTSNGEGSEDSVVQLLPAEYYYAGLAVILPDPTVAGNAQLQFRFQRTTLCAMRSALHPCIYRHRVFHVSHALSSSPGEGVAVCLRDPLLDGSQAVQLTVIVQPTAAAVRMGRIHSCTYTLTLRIPVHAASGIHSEDAVDNIVVYSYVDSSVAEAASVPSKAEGSSVTLTAIPACSMTGLRVSMRETDAWMVVGRARRVLTACALCGPDQHAQAKGWLELRYSLRWELLPVLLGTHALPPLQVEYVLSKAPESEPCGETTVGGKAPQLTERSVLVHPCQLRGHDAVQVVPAAVVATAAGSGGGCSSSVQVLLRSHMLAWV